MKALFIANGAQLSHGQVNVSGGDVRWLMVAKIWQSRGVDIHVLTQEAGRLLCHNFGLDATFHDFGSSSKGGKIAYLDRALHSYMLPRDLRDYDGLIYSTTELMYDVIPGANIRKRNDDARFGVVAHWVPPIKRKNTSLLNSMMFYANNRIGLRAARKYADIIFGVSGPTAQDLEQKMNVPSAKLKVVACGVDLAGIARAPRASRADYDAVFMKRLDGTKGVWDMLDIWAMVVKRRPQARLLLIGHGSDPTMDRVGRIIKENGLENNITVYGPVYDFNKKFELLSSAKMFTLPTYEENWAIVIGEALASGLPVLCYDLAEIRPVWEDSITWVPREDRSAFASKILELLEDDRARSGLASRGKEFVQRYDWEPIALGELETLRSALPE